MLNNIDVNHAEQIAAYIGAKLNQLNVLQGNVNKSVYIKVTKTDKFGFIDNELCIPVLYIHFKNPDHGNDFFREVMIPLSLTHEALPLNATAQTVRLEINQSHPLITDHEAVDKLISNFQRSIKENFIPHKKHKG